MGKFINPHSKIFEHESQSGGNMSKFAIAHAMKKKRMAKGGKIEDESYPQKGVHNGEGGQSMAGIFNGHSKDEGKSGELSKKFAKDEHKKVLSDLQDMPNPKLKGLAEGGSVKSQAKNKEAIRGVHTSDYNGLTKQGKRHAHREMVEEIHSMPRPQLPGDKPSPYAEGGEVESAEMGEESPMSKGDMYDDLVDRIMMHKQYSEGGMVANDVGDGQDADKMENQFDDLVLDDDMEFNYTGANSGDELGNEQEDEDRKDIVSRIMKSNRKKDRNPRPA